MDAQRGGTGRARGTGAKSRLTRDTSTRECEVAGAFEAGGATTVTLGRGSRARGWSKTRRFSPFVMWCTLKGYKQMAPLANALVFAGILIGSAISSPCEYRARLSRLLRIAAPGDNAARNASRPRAEERSALRSFHIRACVARRCVLSGQTLPSAAGRSDTRANVAAAERSSIVH